MSKKNKKQKRFYSVREMTSDEALKYLNALNEFMEMSTNHAFMMFVTYKFVGGNYIEYSYN